MGTAYDPFMLRWRRNRPTRAELIDRKHELEGQIRTLAADVERRRARGQSAADVEHRLAGLRARHYRTRQEIDRADP